MNNNRLGQSMNFQREILILKMVPALHINCIVNRANFYFMYIFVLDFAFKSFHAIA